MSHFTYLMVSKEVVSFFLDHFTAVIALLKNIQYKITARKDAPRVQPRGASMH